MSGPGPFAQLRQRHHLAAQAAAAVNRWAAAAAAVAGTDPPADGKQHWTATVDGCPGAFGWGHTRTAALADLESVLAGWAELKLKDGDTDIPSAGVSTSHQSRLRQATRNSGCPADVAPVAAGERSKHSNIGTLRRRCSRTALSAKLGRLRHSWPRWDRTGGLSRIRRAL